MRDILSTITKWWEAGETFGLATVVGTYHSAPRDPGAALAVSFAAGPADRAASADLAASADRATSPGGTAGEVTGSVSGGCVEGAVYELSLDVCRTGEPALQTYGVSDDDAFAVGLTCGGIIDIFVEPVDKARFPELGEIAAAVTRGEPVAVATVIAGPGQVGARRVIWSGDDHAAVACGEASADAPWHAGASGTLGSGPRLDAAVDDDVRGMLAQGPDRYPQVRSPGRAPRQRAQRVRELVRSGAPDAGVRGDRLRRGRRAGR